MRKKIPIAAVCAAVLAWCSNGGDSAPKGDWSDSSAKKPDAVPNYADGTYRADGPFASPIGRDGIVVSVTLANGDGTIAGLSVQPVADSLSMNAEWISRFSTDIRKVVGKKISDIESLGGVSGSTLTYRGFMVAVESIRTQAITNR